MTPRARSVLAAFAALLTAACDRATGPAFPADAEPFAPSALYGAWWRVAEQCAGLRADMRRVAWFSVPGVQQIGESRYDGAFFARERRIVLASGALRDGQVVRHEMLHAILWLSGTRASGHPREMFYERCGGIVSCNGDCARQTGTDAPPGAPAETLEPADFELALALDAPTASLSDTGWFAVTVEARNPRDHVVGVTLPASPLGLGPVFGADVEGLGHASIRLVAFPPLRPREARRWVFEWPVSRLTPGSYRVRGAFVRDSTAPATLTVVP